MNTAQLEGFALDGRKILPFDSEMLGRRRWVCLMYRVRLVHMVVWAMSHLRTID